MERKVVDKDLYWKLFKSTFIISAFTIGCVFAVCRVKCRCVCRVVGYCFAGCSCVRCVVCQCVCSGV